MTAKAITEQRCVRAALADLVPDFGLLALVEGPESQFGVFAVDHELVAALIETQTIGRLLGIAASERQATKTDATMCADFIDRVLECLEGTLAEAQLPVAKAIEGYRFAVRLDDTRAAKMALEDIPFRCFQAHFNLGDGERSGGFTLMLPFDPAAQIHNANPNTSTPKRDVPDVVMNTPTELHAILHQKRMSLSEVTGLEKGMVLTLPRDALGAVSLMDLSGRTVALCRLGCTQGKRALRIGQYSDAVEGSSSGDDEEILSAVPTSPSAISNDLKVQGGGEETALITPDTDIQVVDAPA